jgi:hypothetical protein
MSSPTIRAPLVRPDRLRPGDSGRLGDEGAHRVGQSVESAVDKGVDRRPDKAIARDGDRSSEADGCERVCVGIAGARRGEV